MRSSGVLPMLTSQRNPPETRTSGSMGSWIWVVDYQLAAQTLQNELYGESNIVLEEGRTTLIDIYKGTSGSGSSDGGGSTVIEDDSDNDDVTVPETTEENTVEFIEGSPEEDFDEDMGSPDIPEETEEETEPETGFEEIPEETKPEETTSDNTLVTIGDEQ